MSLDINLTKPWEQDKPEKVNLNIAIIPIEAIREEIGPKRAEVIDDFRKLVMDGKYEEARKFYETCKEDKQSIGDLNMYCRIHKKILATSRL